MDLSPLFISIKTALFATAFAFVLGILAAYFVLKRQRFKSLADAVFTLKHIRQIIKQAERDAEE